MPLIWNTSRKLYGSHQMKKSDAICTCSFQWSHDFTQLFPRWKERVGLWGVQVKWAPKITSTYRPNAITQVQNHSYGKVWMGAYLMAWNALYHTRCFPIWLEISLTNTTTKFILSVSLPHLSHQRILFEISRMMD